MNLLNPISSLEGLFARSGDEIEKFHEECGRKWESETVDRRDKP
jgi:hypothetical protein